MRVYAPSALGATLALSFLASRHGGGEFLWTWTAMLLAAYPMGAALSFARPFAIQSKRLFRSGGAIAGWFGARALGGECGLAIEDNDLFPKANVTLNGMKIYSDRSVSQIIGYAAAVVETAGSGLVPLFQEMMKNQNGRHYTVDTFRRYEGGGLGAEIRGDVILMGSLAFMKLMKVRMPEGTKVKQAVYLSINGELAGVFALNYAPASAARSSLIAAIRANGLIPILATRDFMNPDPENPGDQVVEAEVPMGEMSSYSIDLRAMTQGRGRYSLKFIRYEEVPQMNQAKIIEDAKKEAEEE